MIKYQASFALSEIITAYAFIVKIKLQLQLLIEIVNIIVKEYTVNTNMNQSYFMNDIFIIIIITNFDDFTYPCYTNSNFVINSKFALNFCLQY